RNETRAGGLRISAERRPARLAPPRPRISTRAWGASLAVSGQIRSQNHAIPSALGGHERSPTKKIVWPAGGSARKAYRSRSAPLGPSGGSFAPAAARARASRSETQETRRALEAIRASARATRGACHLAAAEASPSVSSPSRRQISESTLWKSTHAGAPAE